MKRLFLFLQIIFAYFNGVNAQDDFDRTRYLPIKEGNEWHYKVMDGSGAFKGYEVFEAVRDTTIAGLEYTILDRKSFSSTKLLTKTASCAVHITLMENDYFPIEELNGNCQLHDCFPRPLFSLYRFDYGPGGAVKIGNLDYTVEAKTQVSSGGCGSGGCCCMSWFVSVAADIGPYDCLTANGIPSNLDPIFHTVLDYANIGGNEYGIRVVSLEKSDFGGNEIILERLYPNPFESDFTVEIQAEPTSALEITLFDVLGRLVNRETTTTASNGRLSYRFDRDDLTTGVYVLRIRNSEGEELIRSVIKQ